MQQAPRNLWIPLLIASIIGLGLIGSMFFPPFAVWGGITMAMFGAILLGNPRRILFFFWLWASFQSLILQISNNPAIRYADELFGVLTIGICTASIVWRLADGREVRRFFKIVFALLGVIFASVLLNQSPLPFAANFVLGYLPLPFVFYVAYTTLGWRHWRYVFGCAISLMLLHFTLNIGWRLGINHLPNVSLGNAEDFAQGTFASCSAVAYFMIAMIFLLFSALRLGRKFYIWIGLLLAVAVLQLYITYTNHAYLYFVILLPVYLVVSKQPAKIRMAAVGAVLLAVVAFSFLAAWETQTGYTTISVKVMLDKKNLEHRWDRFIHGPKVELINRIAIQNTGKKPLLWLLGNGPGNGLSSIGMERGSAFAWEYLGPYVANTESFRAGDMTSITGNFYSGILSVWSELGAVGYLLYVGMYFYTVLRVIRRLRSDRYENPLQRVLAEGLVMAMLVFLMSSLLFDVFWAKYFTVGLWIWAALVWDPVAPEGEKTEDGDQRAEVGGQGTEGGRQKSEGRGVRTRDGRLIRPVIRGPKTEGGLSS
jgi:hypothetical protein